MNYGAELTTIRWYVREIRFVSAYNFVVKNVENVLARAYTKRWHIDGLVQRTNRLRWQAVAAGPVTTTTTEIPWKKAGTTRSWAGLHRYVLFSALWDKAKPYIGGYMIRTVFVVHLFIVSVLFFLCFTFVIWTQKTERARLRNAGQTLFYAPIDSRW